MPKRKRGDWYGYARSRLKRRRWGSMPRTWRRRMNRNFQRKHGRRLKTGRTNFLSTFPKSMAVEMIYCDQITVPSKDAGDAPFKFRLNSIHDPDFTSGGHQPRGHDQYQAIYSKYCVVGAEVDVVPIYSSSSNTETTLMGFLDDDSAGDTGYDIENFTELNLMGSTAKVLTIGDGGTQNIQGRKAGKLHFSVNTKKFFGYDKKTQIITAVGIGQGEATDLSGPEEVGSAFGTNPAKPIYLKLHCGGINHDGNNTTVACRVTIKYKVIVHSPKEVGAS